MTELTHERYSLQSDTQHSKGYLFRCTESYFPWKTCCRSLLDLGWLSLHSLEPSFRETSVRDSTTSGVEVELTFEDSLGVDTLGRLVRPSRSLGFGCLWFCYVHTTHTEIYRVTTPIKQCVGIDCPNTQ